jgi:fumarylpyruvate hydrolase
MTDAAIRLDVNGQTRQSSNINQLTWSVPEIIAHFTRYEGLQAGDLIMTGTPEGVSAVLPGDQMVGSVDGLGQIRVKVKD